MNAYTFLRPINTNLLTFTVFLDGGENKTNIVVREETLMDASDQWRKLVQTDRLLSKVQTGTSIINLQGETTDELHISIEHGLEFQDSQVIYW